MKKYFLYELKRNWQTLLVLTVFSCMIYLTAVISNDFIFEHNGTVYVFDTLILIPMITLMVLCTLLPILMFSFKMNGRQTDCFYSLPIRREKIYLIKSLVGLLLVIIPYTAAYWLGFAATVIKPNVFELSGFVPAYVISLPLALLLFGINAFVFTRANRTVDGIIFVVLFSCAAVMPAFVICRWASPTGYYMNVPYGLSPSFWTTYSPLTWLSTKYNYIISGRGQGDAIELPLYLTAAVLGVAAWAGLFLTARREKAENAEQISDSPFGYVVMIPLYLTSALANLERSSESILFIALILIVAAVGYIIFRRGIKLKIPDLISLAGATCLGILLSNI